MSNTNENILKSLAVLEQNLNEINSAKNQVNQVVENSDNLAQVIQSYNSSFDGISKNIQTLLNEFKSINSDTISKLSIHIENFNNEVIKLSNINFNKSFNSAKNEIVIQFEKDISERLKVFDDKTLHFNKEVNRLTEFNFTNSINSIETKVIEQFNKDLQISLTVFDKKSNDLKLKIDELKTQILRLEKINIESEFNNILKKLTNQNEEQSKKYNELKQQNENLIVGFNKQNDELKSSKTLLYITIAISIIGIILNIVLK